MYEILLGGLLSALTAYLGKKFPNTNNLVVLAGLALVAGIIGYAVYSLYGDTNAFAKMYEIAKGGSVWAISIYQILANLNKIDIMAD